MNNTFLLTLNDLNNLLRFGHGWLELHYIGDDEDPERYELYECVWVNGWVLIDDGAGNTYSPEMLKRWYNRRGGVRVWHGKPDLDERRGAAWDD